MTFTHRYVPSAHVGARTLILLHGTGGDESSLLDLGRTLDANAALIGVRGNSREEGMNRFFRRFTEGLFDEEDIKAQAMDLSQFLQSMNPAGERIAVGYSNGANMAAALLLLHPEVLDGAILFRSMLPLQPPELPDLTGKRILMANGDADPLAPMDSAGALAGLFTQANAQVEHMVIHGGHSLTRGEILAAGEWLLS